MVAGVEYTWDVFGVTSTTAFVQKSFGAVLPSLHRFLKFSLMLRG